MVKQGRRDAEIQSTEVWLFDQDGQDLGFVLTAQAQQVAYERGLALARMDEISSPPRYRMVDPGAHQATEARAARLARGQAAAARGTAPKELRLRLAIGVADLETRRRSAASLLAAGHRVKIRIENEHRQRSNPVPARTMLDSIVRDLADVGRPEGKPFNEKGAVAVVLVPS